MRYSVFGLLAASLVSYVTAQEIACWPPDGKVAADNETYVPCNKLGIQQDDVFSSCCALDGPAEKRDTCSSLGLCIGSDRRVRRGFCTDRTWKSKACVNVCVTTEEGGDPSNSTVMTPCNDGSNKYCCGDTTSCCSGPKAVMLTTQESVCTAHSLNSDEGSGADAAKFKNATIGLAVVAGVMLLVALASAFWFLRQNKALKQQLADEKLASEHHRETSTMHERASTVPTFTDSNHPGGGSVYGGSTTHQSPNPGHSHPYYNKTPQGSPPPQHQNPLSPNSEVHGNIARYSELDGGTTNRSEMASPDPYTQQNRNSTQPSNFSVPMHSPGLPQ
ncbi:uncharacterized protein PG998_015230 [Apiospora kogelbergensis]|uniref:uncharacterized protein n=1 Tax=Apiospora kogelbergensis TaxID=1337665 RepID=UPI00312E4BCB